MGGGEQGCAAQQQRGGAALHLWGVRPGGAGCMPCAEAGAAACLCAGQPVVDPIHGHHPLHPCIARAGQQTRNPPHPLPAASSATPPLPLRPSDRDAAPPKAPYSMHALPRARQSPWPMPPLPPANAEYDEGPSPRHRPTPQQQPSCPFYTVSSAHGAARQLLSPPPWPRPRPAHLCRPTPDACTLASSPLPPLPARPDDGRPAARRCGQLHPGKGGASASTRCACHVRACGARAGHRPGPLRAPLL